MVKGIKGKVAVITGGASGIGKGTALAFAKAGAKVVIVTGHSVKAAGKVVKQIKDMKQEAIFIQCDVSNETQVEAMVKEVVAKYGKIDFAFNNAGVGPEGIRIPFCPLTELTEKDWDWVIDTNMKGVFLCMKHELRQMRKQQSGVIVNTSSNASLHTASGFGAYGPSKVGVNELTKIAAAENLDVGIRVNAVCPGLILGTGLSGRLFESIKKKTAGTLKLPDENKKMITGVIDDIAGVVVWLCSDDASFINGDIMVIDGGMVTT